MKRAFCAVVTALAAIGAHAAKPAKGAKKSNADGATLDMPKKREAAAAKTPAAPPGPPLPAWAEGIPNWPTSPARAALATSLRAQEWTRAAALWDPAWKSHAYGVSISGRAARALIDKLAGLELRARDEWRALGKTESIEPAALRAAARDAFDAATTAGAAERAVADRRAAVAKAIAGDESGALAALHAIDKSDAAASDIRALAEARVFYQKGDLQAALAAYGRVSRRSENWLEAQEEAGWTRLRRSDWAGAIATSKTVADPAVAGLARPGALLLRAVAQLRLCDEAGAAATVELFRARFRPRMAALTELARSLAEDARNPDVDAFIELAGRQRPTEPALGAPSRNLPRATFADIALRRDAVEIRALEAEAAAADRVASIAAAVGGAGAAARAPFEAVRAQDGRRASALREGVAGRVRELASQEIDEIAGVVGRLHLVEAEILQRLAFPRQAGVPAPAGKPAPPAAREDKVWYPVERETWFDELGRYALADAPGCGPGTPPAPQKEVTR